MEPPRGRYTGVAAKGEIELVRVQRLISNRWFTVVVYDALSPSENGQAPKPRDQNVIRWSVDFPAGATAVPITKDGKIVLIREMHAAFGRASWKLPTGSKGTDESFATCALREADEEAGVRVTAETELVEMGDAAPDPNNSFDGTRIVLVRNVDIGTLRPDESEQITEARSFTFREIENLIQRGEIFDALSLAALCLLQILLRRDAKLRESLHYAFEET